MTTTPRWFSDGYSYRSNNPGKSNSLFRFENSLQPSADLLKQNRHQTAVNSEFPNAYTPEEVIDFIKREKSNGALQKKINQYIQRQNPEVFAKVK